MVIKNEKAGLIIIPLRSIPEAIGIYGKTQIDLVPGCNEIPETVWELVKLSFPIINAKVKDKKLIEVATKKKKKEKIVTVDEIEKDEKGKEKIVAKKTTKKYDGIESTEFEALPIEKQEELIQDTWSIRTLNNWRKRDIKDTVRLVIDEKLKEIRDRKKESEYNKNKR